MKKKWIVLGCILLVIGLCAGVDYIRYRQVDVTIERLDTAGAERQEGEPVLITVRAAYHSGEPVVGHNLFALSLSGGSFKGCRLMTGEDGTAQFAFYPGSAYFTGGEREISLQFRDESNSWFIEMYPSVKLDFTLQDAAADEGGGTIDDFLK